jgi:hypothetical protein
MGLARWRSAIELRPLPAATSPRSEEDLAREVALLDRAGQAIAERDVAGALLLLDNYQAEGLTMEILIVGGTDRIGSKLVSKLRDSQADDL